jgi:hypothetical protein
VPLSAWLTIPGLLASQILLIVLTIAAMLCCPLGSRRLVIGLDVPDPIAATDRPDARVRREKGPVSYFAKAAASDAGSARRRQTR